MQPPFSDNKDTNAFNILTRLYLLWAISPWITIALALLYTFIFLTNADLKGLLRVIAFLIGIFGFLLWMKIEEEKVED